ncbi:MAG: alpha-amylase family glycosyl hydrolase [Planctomycetota bacterium]
MNEHVVKCQAVSISYAFTDALDGLNRAELLEAYETQLRQLKQELAESTHASGASKLRYRKAELDSIGCRLQRGFQMNEILGASLRECGCNFRVWAPHAEKIEVLLQSGSQWDSESASTEVELEREGDHWVGFVEDATAGMLYRYRIKPKVGAAFERLDAVSRDTIHSELTRRNPASGNASIIVSNEPYDWAPFETPQFPDFLIYQYHTGSFAGRKDHADKEIATFADVQTKLGYIRELGFNAIEPLPVQEFAMSRSWGYNPASFYAVESAYGRPGDLKDLVDNAHRQGLAVIFDVVYNHAGPGDNVLWQYDGWFEHDHGADGGIYFEGGRWTDWGQGPAWWKKEVQEFFFQNACMYFEDYNADGLRFDVTTQIDGNHLREVLWRLQQRYPTKYFIAEHLPADPWITTFGNFDASWLAKSHHDMQRALNGERPIEKVKSFLGWDGFSTSSNLVKYTMGSHDDVGDDKNGNAKDGLTNWDNRHRYLIDQFGGRSNWHARAKCRLAWALNVAMPGTPMMFMGSECHMGSPNVAWGYWHDGHDNNGDHRFDWSIAGDPIGSEMRRLVNAANRVRWENPALRSDTLIVTHEDHTNQVLAFKRWAGGNLVLTIVNLSENDFGNHSYGVHTDNQFGRWTQTLCSQDAEFGGWDGAGNAFHEPVTQSDSRIYINVPKWSVVMFRLENPFG